MTESQFDNLDNFTPEDLQIHAETLLRQARIAHDAGYTRFAANLDRAAELTRVPNDILLKMYEALRPRRSTFDQLMQIATLLESTYDAPITAAFVREAAEAYKIRSLLLDA